MHSKSITLTKFSHTPDAGKYVKTPSRINHKLLIGMCSGVACKKNGLTDSSKTKPVIVTQRVIILLLVFIQGKLKFFNLQKSVYKY